MTQINWTDYPNAVDGEAVAYDGATSVEDSTFVIMPLIYPDATEPVLYILMRRADGTPSGFADVDEFDTIQAAKDAAAKL